jgi:hypothetical protein
MQPLVLFAPFLKASTSGASYLSMTSKSKNRFELFLNENNEMPPAASLPPCVRREKQRLHAKNHKQAKTQDLAFLNQP